MNPEHCERCGKEFKEGERAIGVTTGEIDYDIGGFKSDDCEPWAAVYCQKCQDQRRNMIAMIDNVDVKLLREQRNYLLAQMKGNNDCPEGDGIVALLDAVLDVIEIGEVI
jgi:hypothetical protein